MTDGSGGDATRVDPRVERTLDEIHEAVLALLREDGLTAVTHAHVAERAGVGRATVYRHFADRGELLASAIRARRPEVALPEPTGDPATDARALLRTLARHMNDNPMMVDMLVLLRRAEDDPDLTVAMQHLMPAQQNPAAALIEAARRNGRLRPDVDPLVAALMLLGPLLGRAVMLRQTITDEVIDHVVDVWLAGVAVEP